MKLDESRLNAMSGSRLRELHDIMIRIFPDRTDLELLLIRLNRNYLTHYTSDAGHLKTRILDVLMAAQSGSWLGNLLRAAMKDRPGSTELRTFAAKYQVVEAPNSDRPAEEQSSAAVVLGAVAVLVVLLVVIVVAIASASRPATGKVSTASDVTPLGELIPSTTKPVSAPDGYTTRRGPDGWTIAVPTAWSASPDGDGRIIFADRSGAPTLLVQVIAKAGPSAIDGWYNLEAGVRANSTDYQRITIRDADGHDGSTAAIWEFTRVSDGRKMHVLDFAVVRNGHGYALLWTVPDDQWDSQLGLMRAIFVTFRPGPSDAQALAPATVTPSDTPAQGSTLGVTCSNDSNPTGAYLNSVFAGGPAKQAGLVAGDVITEIVWAQDSQLENDLVGSCNLSGTSSLKDLLQMISSDRTVTITFVRNGMKYDTQVTLGSRTN